MPYAPKPLESPYSAIPRERGKHRRVYKTAAWLRFRELRLAQQPTCQECEKHGRITLATDVHHDPPLRTGVNPFDTATTFCLCGSCHSRITRTGQ